MSIKQHALDTMIGYLAAHKAWKAAPPGQAKVDAKQVRGQKHSEMIEAAELYKPQHKPER